MIKYIGNILFDVVYGYVEVECANKKCKRIHKFPRNNNITQTTNYYCCNMGCAFESYNQDQELELK